MEGTGKGIRSTVARNFQSALLAPGAVNSHLSKILREIIDKTTLFDITPAPLLDCVVYFTEQV